MVEKTKQIYIFENTMYPLLKIGMSDDPIKRLKQVQGSSGFPLKLAFESEAVINPLIVERLIHLELQEFRKGGEWFDVDIKTAKKVIDSVLKVSTKGEYKDLTKNYTLEDECVTMFERNILLDSNSMFIIKEVEPFIYESNSFYYYIVFKQGKLERTMKFCNKGLAIKFKKENIDRLIL